MDALVANGVVYATVFVNQPNASPLLYAMNAKTGATVWGPVSVGGYNLSYAAGRLFVDGPPTAFDAATGTQLWSNQDISFGPIAVAADGLLWSQNSEGIVIGLSQKTGQQVAQNQYVTATGSPGFDGNNATVAVAGKSVYLSSGAETEVKLTTKGQIVWAEQADCDGGYLCSGGGGGTMTVAGNRVFASDGQFILNSSNGRVLGAIGGTPIVAPDRVFIVSPNELSAETRSTETPLWTRRIGTTEPQIMPVATTKAIYIVTGRQIEVRSASTGRSLGRLTEPAAVKATTADTYSTTLDLADSTLVFTYGNTVTAYGSSS